LINNAASCVRFNVHDKLEPRDSLKRFEVKFEAGRFHGENSFLPHLKTKSEGRIMKRFIGIGHFCFHCPISPVLLRHQGRLHSFCFR